MNLHEKISRRFCELENLVRSISYPDGADWARWTTSVLDLLRETFGERSEYYRRFLQIQDYTEEQFRLEPSKGVFGAAKSDFEKSYPRSIELAISREVLGDFIALGREALLTGNKNVAAVLVYAALEDALKRYALHEGLKVDGMDLSSVIGALKSKGLLANEQKRLVERMPTLRDAAMHADWERVDAENVGAILGYVEAFLAKHFRPPAQTEH